MTVKTRETLMQRAMNGKPIMGQDLRDLIDTMFWLKASPEQKAAEVVKQVIGRSTPPAEAGFPEVPGSGFVKIGADGKWLTDPSTYLTKPMGDSYYFRNELFPMDPSLYLAGDRTFKNFTDSARASFTGGDGIDIIAGDIRVDSTVSRVGHAHALTLSGDVSGSGVVAGTIATTVNAIRGGVVPPPGSAGYFYWTGSSYSWVATPPPTTIALDDLADVQLASVLGGQVLWYDGSVGQWINKMLGANDIPAHASRHHFDGSDPLAGQSIAGLLTSSSPTFSGLNVRTASAGTLADISFRATTDFRRMVIRWDNPNDRLELFSNNDDGSSRAERILIPRSSSIPVSILLGLTVTGTTTLSTSLTGMLKATAGVVGVAGAADLPLHASRHQWDGADPIQGQQLSGLRAHETPTFGGIRGGSVIGYLPFLENNGTEIMRLSSTGMLVHQNISLDGDLRIGNMTGILYAQNGTVRVALGADLPAHTHFTSEVAEDTNLWFTYQRARDAITGNHPISVVNGVVSHVDTDGYRHVPANGSGNSGKFLVAGGSPGSYTWETIAAGSLPVHAFRHHFDGSDPLAGQSISGLRTTDSPEFNRLTLGSELRLKRGGVQEWGLISGTDGALELASRNSDWSAVDWPLTIQHGAGGVIRLGGTSRPVNLTYSLQVGGTTTINSSREGILTRLSVIKSLGATISAASRVDLLNNDSSWGQSFWSDSGGNLRLAFLQGDSTWTDRFTFMRTGALQIGGVETITSTRGGRFADLVVTGQTTLATSLTGMLKATSGVISVAGASDLPLHATRHHWDGADPITGQSIAGLLTTDSPTWNALTVTSIKIGALNGILKSLGGNVSASSLFKELSFATQVIAPSYAGSNVGAGLIAGSASVYALNKGLGIYEVILEGNTFLTSLKYIGSNSGILKTLSTGEISIAVGSDLPSHSHNYGDVLIPYSRIPYGDEIGVMTHSDLLRFADFEFRVGSNVRISAISGDAYFPYVDAGLIVGDVQPDRDTIISGGSRTLPTADSVGKSVRFCAGTEPGTYTVSVETPASEAILYRSRTTGVKLSATSLDIVDSATEFVCHEVGRWTAIGY